MLRGYLGKKGLDNLLTDGDKWTAAVSADTIYEGWGKVKNSADVVGIRDEVFTGSERGWA
jgi:hypothetical protein